MCVVIFFLFLILISTVFYYMRVKHNNKINTLNSVSETIFFPVLDSFLEEIQGESVSFDRVFFNSEK